VAERRDRAPAEQAEWCVVPSRIIRNPAKPGDDFKAQQKLEFDRWRTAIAIVEVTLCNAAEYMLRQKE